MLKTMKRKLSRHVEERSGDTYRGSFPNYIRPCDVLLRLIAETMIYIRKEMLHWMSDQTDAQLSGIVSRTWTKLLFHCII